MEGGAFLSVKNQSVYKIFIGEKIMNGEGAKTKGGRRKVLNVRLL